MVNKRIEELAITNFPLPVGLVASNLSARSEFGGEFPHGILLLRD
jgi:hypothetical protein